MEIIKQIKAAETQAKEIIEKAKADAVKIAEDFSTEQQEQLAAADKQRRDAIDKAVATAEADGQAEVEKLISDGAEQRQAMENKAKSNLDAAAAKVVAKIVQG
jgi:V/A-type H+-transporting ATPase subunit G/H